jgi:hypothetical protein
MTVKRRLGRLEASLEKAVPDDEEAVHREMLRRLTDEELDAYEAAATRLAQGGEPYEPAEGDRPTFRRAEYLCEPSRHENTSWEGEHE